MILKAVKTYSNLQDEFTKQNNLFKIRYSYFHTAFPVQTFLFIKIENIYSAPLWQQGDERIQKLGPVLRLQFDDCKRKTDTHMSWQHANKSNLLELMVEGNATCLLNRKFSSARPVGNWRQYCPLPCMEENTAKD